MDMETASTAPNVLLRLLSLLPSSNTVIANQKQQQQQQQGGKLQFLSLSLSPTSKVIVKKKGKAEDGAFQCRTCDRRFATFQALGGHRTSHKRPRVRADGLELQLGASPSGKGAAAAKANNVHRCHTCGQVFPTGQALGGHMRRHRAAAETDTTTSIGLSKELTNGDNDEGRPGNQEEEVLQDFDEDEE